MRWATVDEPAAPDGSAAVCGLVEAGAVRTLAPGTALVDLLGDDGERLDRAADTARRDPRAVVPLASARLRAPIPRPASVRDFSAFEAHVRTARAARGLAMDPDWYRVPVFYFSNPLAVIGGGAAVAIPPGSAELDYELEVAAVVGRGGADLSPDEAERAIAGYCILNDWSARDLQRREMRLGLGPAKGKDFATSLGPFLVTPDELPQRHGGNAAPLAMTARVNGVEYSRGWLADLHYSFGEMLAYASRGIALVPGEVVGSGTCGTGCILELSLTHGADRFPWLRAGDVVELEVEALGVLGNPVAPGAAPRRLRTEDG